MISISLCMIVKNEAKTIAHCLESVKYTVDEIILVDTGSSDQTKEIAGSYTDQIFDFEWIDNFSVARNFSFNQAKMDYILWLDADDVLLEEDQKKMFQLKQTLDTSVDSVTMIYNYAFDEYGNTSLSFRRNRLVKRLKNFQWHGAVHEYLAVEGNILDSDIVVTHKRTNRQSGRNLSIFEKLLAKSEKLTPRDLYYYANELRDNGQLQNAAEHYQLFLDCGQGWVEDNIAACDTLADIFCQLGDAGKEREFILRSFLYDSPRAELCCRMGYYHARNKDYKKASFWYELATNLEKPENNCGFFNEAYWTWLPHFQLCVCFYYLGDYEKSFKHNEIARNYRPFDQDVLRNKDVLDKILNNVITRSNPISFIKGQPLRSAQIGKRQSYERRLAGRRGEMSAAERPGFVNEE